MKKPKTGIDLICYELAIVIICIIMNILWFVTCILIWPFKKQFIYDWRKCTNWVLDTIKESQKHGK